MSTEQEAKNKHHGGQIGQHGGRTPHLAKIYLRHWTVQNCWALEKKLATIPNLKYPVISSILILFLLTICGFSVDASQNVLTVNSSAPHNATWATTIPDFTTLGSAQTCQFRSISTRNIKKKSSPAP